MEVGAADFERCLPSLRDRVRRAAFLGEPPPGKGRAAPRPSFVHSLFDSPAERYLKARQSVQRFTVAQLGECWSEAENHLPRFVVHSYNFFLFPSTLGLSDVEFTLSASSIQFLSRYGFDYNKVCNLSARNLEQRKKNAFSSIGLSALSALPKFLLFFGFFFFFSLGYQVFEVQLVLREALQNVWTQPLGDKKVMVKKVSPQHRQLLENSPNDCCRKELILLSARGFTNLFQTLVKAKKPLVGHNMLMDLMHLHDKFYKPLPESYEEFKRNIHNLFPVLIDTKTVTKSVWKVRCTGLLVWSQTLSFTQKRGCLPLVLHAEKKSPHEAGYDAFLCGSGKMPLNDAVEADPSFSQYLTVLAEYLNKVNLIRGGVSSINFSGEDSPCEHPPALIVHVRGWPGLNERQIYEEFKPLCRFDVRRLSKDQFTLLSNKFDDVRLVLRDYKHHPRLRVSVRRHWRHSPRVNCLLQVSGVVALWSLLAFVLGGAPCSSW
uniref:PARN like, ribonuclease domain containing 1 n=1 Tax=Calidris pygmaea TaxID=425635 RepID=A0A8C3KAV5_9CHAR